jgi:hypothetical protein
MKVWQAFAIWVGLAVWFPVGAFIVLDSGMTITIAIVLVGAALFATFFIAFFVTLGYRWRDIL